MFERDVHHYDCPKCRGTGRRWSRSCWFCEGSGTVWGYARAGRRLWAWAIDAALAFVPALVFAIALLASVGTDDDPTTDDPSGFGALAGLLVFLPLYAYLRRRRRRKLRETS